jgi:hypothetical protein
LAHCLYRFQAETDLSKDSDTAGRWKDKLAVGSERIQRYTRAWEEEMPYRISYLDTSMLADERLTAGTSQTEEFSTEPAALARARELIEDSHYHAISFSGNSGERLVGVFSR